MNNITILNQNTAGSNSSKDITIIGIKNDQDKKLNLSKSDSKNALKGQLHIIEKNTDFLNPNKNKIISVNI